MAENSYSIPVYRGWPERPYAVLGSLRFEDAHKAWDEGIFRMAASEAKSKGGDAVIIRHGSEFGVGMITGTVGDGKVFSVNQTTALVIKWKKPEEIVAENAVRTQFEQALNAKYTTLAGRPEITSLLVEYISSQGVRLDSSEAQTQVAEIMQAAA